MRAMKDSGIEWIGQIPAHWTTCKIKNVASLITGNTPSKADGGEYYADEGLMWVKPDNLQGTATITRTKEYLSSVGATIARVVPPFTPLVCCIGSVGKIGVSNHEVAFNQQINAVCFNDNVDKRFGLYYLMSQEEQHKVRANGNVLPILNSEQQGMIPFVFPPLCEQTAIATYVDERCSEIEVLITAKEKTNALLKERRQSIIYEAVTKGLNPDAPMKDSGIEWIGEIPSDWQVIPLSKVSERMNNGYVGPTRNIFFDSGIRYLQSLHIKEGKIIFEKAPYYVSPEWAAEHSLGTVHTGDVLIVQTGDIGQVACVPEEYNECNCHALIIVTPRCKFCVGEYLSYLLQSHYGRNQLLSCRTGALHPHLNSGNISSIKLPIPTIDEQQAIVAKLNQECEEYDNAIQQNNLTIEKLKEYRQSIIYEAVTGKIEV